MVRNEPLLYSQDSNPATLMYSYQNSLRVTEVFESCEMHLRNGATSWLCDIRVRFVLSTYRIYTYTYICIYMLFSQTCSDYFLQILQGKLFALSIIYAFLFPHKHLFVIWFSSRHILQRFCCRGGQAASCVRFVTNQGFHDKRFRRTSKQWHTC